MKVKLFLAAGAIMLLAACGKERLPKDGMLGELPSIVMENYKQEGKLREKMAKSSDSEEATKALVNGIAQSKAFEEKMKIAGEKIVGNEIPTDVAKNIHVSVPQPLKIGDVSKNGTVRLVGEGELLSDGTYMPNKGVVRFSDLRIILYTEDGKACYAANLNTVPDNATPHDDLYSKGTKLKFNAHLRLQPWNAEDMAALKSITITVNDRDDFRNAEKASKEAKESFDKVGE